MGASSKAAVSRVPYEGSAALEMREAEDTAGTLGLEGVTSEIRRSEDSRLRSMPLKAAWRPFTSATTHSQTQIHALSPVLLLH